MASDERAQRAAEVLRDTLVDLSGRTSSELFERLDAINGEFETVMTGLGYPEIREAIRAWRDGAAAEVKAAFKRLLGLAKSPEAAESLLWEGIDAAFEWSPPSRENSKVFGEWLARSRVAEIEGFKVRSAKCERYRTLEDSLNCDFRTLFELCIAQVAEEIDHKTIEATDADVLLPAAEQRDLKSKDKETRERARARIVVEIRRELTQVEADLVYARRPPEEVVPEHPKYRIFRKDMRGFLRLWISKSRTLPETALLMAAQIGRRGPDTMRQAWKKYHREFDGEPT